MQWLDKFLREEGYDQALPEALSQFLKAQGFEGQNNEALYYYLESLGYWGALPEKMKQWSDYLAQPFEPPSFEEGPEISGDLVVGGTILISLGEVFGFPEPEEEWRVQGRPEQTSGSFEFNSTFSPVPAGPFVLPPETEGLFIRVHHRATNSEGTTNAYSVFVGPVEGEEP